MEKFNAHYSTNYLDVLKYFKSMLHCRDFNNSAQHYSLLVYFLKTLQLLW